MKAQKITATEQSERTVASLPTHPTAESYQGAAMTPTELKQSFDRLPLLITERFNNLIDDISASPSESISAVIKTGISNKTLYTMFVDITSGNFASYMKVNGKSLYEEIYNIKKAIRELGGQI